MSGDIKDIYIYIYRMGYILRGAKGVDIKVLGGNDLGFL